ANEIHLIIDERTKRKQYSLFFYLYTDLTDPETQEKIQCRKIIGGKGVNRQYPDTIKLWLF
ncbi:unnamed protein product, partial [marine sediment metagenome]